jgi:hypothetical protein
MVIEHEHMGRTNQNHYRNSSGVLRLAFDNFSGVLGKHFFAHALDFRNKGNLANQHSRFRILRMK